LLFLLETVLFGCLLLFLYGHLGAALEAVGLDLWLFTHALTALADSRKHSHSLVKTVDRDGLVVL
jgi:hypothetical protein